MKLRNKFLSLSMMLALLGSSITQTSVNAAEIVNIVAENQKSDKLISALQMIYSCQTLRNFISSNGVGGFADSIGSLFAQMSSMDGKVDATCFVPQNLEKQIGIEGTTLEVMQRIFANLGCDTNDLFIPIEILALPDVNVESEYFFASVSDESNNPNADIPNEVKRGNDTFELKSMTVELNAHDAVCLKSGEEWVIIDNGQVMPVGPERNQIFNAGGKLKIALYCKKGSGIVGLANTGNSCYFNAALQQLCNCEDFRNLIRDLARVLKPGPDTMLSRLNILFQLYDKGDENILQQTMNDLFGMYVDHKVGDAPTIALETIFNLLKSELKENKEALEIVEKIGINFLDVERVANISECLSGGFLENGHINGIFSGLGGAPCKNVLISVENFLPSNEEDRGSFNLDCPELVQAQNEQLYSLKSISVMTSPKGGHYIAWVLGENGEWTCISDSNANVRCFSTLEEVINQINEEHHKISTVLYSKIQ